MPSNNLLQFQCAYMLTRLTRITSARLTGLISGVPAPISKKFKRQKDRIAVFQPKPARISGLVYKPMLY